MEVYRIHVTSWTSSFRYPNLISGFQPTLPVPPLSTLMGLIMAAKGEYMQLEQEKLGYVFIAGSKAVDLETIYQMGNSLKDIKSNIIKREFYCDNHLFIYTDSEDIAAWLNSPCYPLLLGRSNDLASIRGCKKIKVTEKNELAHLKGTIVPFTRYRLPTVIQALPQGFTNTIPRRSIGTKPYCLLDSTYVQRIPVQAAGFSDSVQLGEKTMDWDVYWQELN